MDTQNTLDAITDPYKALRETIHTKKRGRPAYTFKEKAVKWLQNNRPTDENSLQLYLDLSRLVLDLKND